MMFFTRLIYLRIRKQGKKELGEYQLDYNRNYLLAISRSLPRQNVMRTRSAALFISYGRRIGVSLVVTHFTIRNMVF